MDMEDRLKTLEAEFQVTKEELRQILMDIRAHIMEAQTPFQHDSVKAISARSGAERG